jgi:glycerol-3-phosphate dehydrogenase (NAD(P)+)
MSFKTAGVLGAGAWGTALAQVCARAKLATTLWARETEVVQQVWANRENQLFLPGVKLDDAIAATSDLADLGGCDLVLAVAPAQHLRASLTALAPHLAPGTPVVLCAKGVERGSLKLMTQVLAETVPHARAAVLSGPSFAAEVARGLPTAVTLAAEAGGAIKNVLAIACGVVEGRALGRSAHAALITRGFAEMTRFATALGARAETVAGLCGLGDLVLTCSSPQSRNMSVGLALGRGLSLKEALAGKLSVAEGVESAPAARELAARLGVEAPICEAVAAVLAGEIDVGAAIEGLLSRPLKAER